MNTIVRYDERVNWGNNKYRWNTSGKLLINLHKVYNFDEVNDYMSDSFTTQDVPIDLSIKSNCYYLNCRFDLITNDISKPSPCQHGEET